MASRTYGILLVILSAIFWSTAGPFVRMANVESWTLIGWRSLFAFLTLAGFAAYEHRTNLIKAVTGMGSSGVVAVTISVLSTISYIFALNLTTVANVMIVYAVLPFIAALISYVWIRERVTVRLLGAGLAAFFGIAIMAGSAATAKDILGIIAAFVMTATFASQIVHSKVHPQLDLNVAMALAAGACGLIAIPFMEPGLPSPTALLACALYGGLTSGLAYVLALNGGRYITAGESGFIQMLDVVLGPLLVWMFFAEQPGETVLAGGAIVLSAVVWYLAPSVRVPAVP
ncbi:DMT family transporter [Hyphomicrobium sp.]|uniref:DMT family transporter n=1 Tax=Hyphomicrobium sp. TaxID=82 RepID=UPI0035684081